MPTAEIKIRGFTYYNEVQDPSNIDNTIKVAAFATRGEEVELSDEDYERGVEIDAFKTDDDQSVGESLEDQAVVDMSDDELILWLEEKSPNVDDTVEAAEGDPESAQRLLDAEQSASGGDPRQGVVDGLEKVIAKSGSSVPQ